MAGEESRRGPREVELQGPLSEAKAALERVQSELEAAKQPETGGFRAWWKAPVEPNKPRWTVLAPPAIQAAVAAAAAFIAFVPAYNNFRIREEKNREDRQFTEAKNREERLQNAQERLNTPFKDVQSRLASQDEKTRAAAALPLAERATRDYPQASTPSPAPSAKASLFHAENTPSFLRAAQPFAIALTIGACGAIRSATTGAGTAGCGTSAISTSRLARRLPSRSRRPCSASA